MLPAMGCALPVEAASGGVWGCEGNVKGEGACSRLAGRPVTTSHVTGVLGVPASPPRPHSSGSWVPLTMLCLFSFLKCGKSKG